MEIKSEKQKEREKITLIAILLAGSCFLTYYFHVILETGILFTHFFYIPIILASLWWKRKGLAVAIFLAAFLLFSHYFLRAYVVTANDYLRALMFIAISFIVAFLSERIAKAQRKTAHLNAVLYAIRNINQLITREKDHDRLLKGVCGILIETRGYHNAWIALLNETGGIVTTVEAGLGMDFLPMEEQLKRGELTACGRRATSQSDAVITKDPPSTCTDCPLSAMYSGRAAMTVRLEHAGKVYGLLCASIPADLTAYEEELALFKDVAGDIAFALNSIELGEERKHAEEAILKRRVIENIFKFVPEGLLTFTDKLNLFRTNKAFQDIVQKYSANLNYTEQELMEIIIEQVKNRIINEDYTEIRIPKNKDEKAKNS